MTGQPSLWLKGIQWYVCCCKQGAQLQWQLSLFTGSNGIIYQAHRISAWLIFSLKSKSWWHYFGVLLSFWNPWLLKNKLTTKTNIRLTLISTGDRELIRLEIYLVSSFSGIMMFGLGIFNLISSAHNLFQCQYDNNILSKLYRLSLIMDIGTLLFLILLCITFLRKKFQVKKMCQNLFTNIKLGKLQLEWR